MSVEDSLHALLAGHAPLAALVGAHIAQNAAPEGDKPPLVVYAVVHNPVLGLDGTVLADQCTFELQCWGIDAIEADQVADACVAAIATAPRARGACITTRSSTHDPEQGLDATVLSGEWFG